MVSLNHSDDYCINGDQSDRWFDYNKFMKEATNNEQPHDKSPWQGREKQNDPAGHPENIINQTVETPCVRNFFCPAVDYRQNAFRMLVSAGSSSPPSEGQPVTFKEIERSNNRETSLASQHNAKQNSRASASVIRKRKVDGQCHDLGDSGKEIAFDRIARLIGEDASGEPERDIKATRSLTLSTDFIVHRFGISPAHDISRRWRCPFPTSEALPDGRCLATFGVHTIRSHIIDHVNHHNSIRPQEPVQCPFHSQECCKWTAVAGANREFPRHVAEVHLRVNAATCSCGTSLSRGKRDQIIRHLRHGHQENLEKKRKTDPSTPAFVDIEDPQLVEEEWQWREGMRGNGNVDKGEGSSDGRIKRRRFF